MKYETTYACGHVLEAGSVPFLCPNGCCSTARSYRKAASKDAPEVNTSGMGVQDSIDYKKGSLTEAAVHAAVADSIPLKLKSIDKLGGIFTPYELDVIAKGVALVKADALMKISKANTP